MPRIVVCPGCGSRLNAPDAAVGKGVRCPRCRTAVPVQAAKPTASAQPRPPAEDLPEDLPDDLPPRRRRPPADDEPDDRPRRRKKSRSRKSGAPVGLLLGVAAAVVLLAGGGFAAYWFGFRDKPQVAGPATPADDGKAAGVPDGWQLHAPEGCGFRAAFPAPPFEDVPTSQGTLAFQATGRMFRSPAGGFAASPSGVICAVGRVTPSPAAAPDRRRQAGFQSFKSDAIEALPGARVLGRTAAPVGTHPGEEVVVETPAGNGPATFWVIRSAAVGNDVFVMAVWKENDRPPAAIVSRFFGSLEVTGPAAWAAPTTGLPPKTTPTPTPTAPPTPTLPPGQLPTDVIAFEETHLVGFSLAPDGGTVGVMGLGRRAKGGEPGLVSAFYDLRTRQRVGVPIDEHGPGAIAAGGKTVAFSDDSRVFVRDVAYGLQTRVAEVPGGSRMFAYAPDGKMVVTAVGSKLTFRPWPPGAAPVREVDAGSPVHAVSGFFLGGTRVATLQYDADAVVVRVWDVPAGRVADTFPLGLTRQRSEFPNETLQVAEDGRAMTTRTMHGMGVVWDLAEKKRMTWTDQKPLTSFHAPAPGGRVLYQEMRLVNDAGTTKAERFVALADIRQGVVVNRLLYPPGGYDVTRSLGAITPDGRRVAVLVPSQSQVMVWDLP